MVALYWTYNKVVLWLWDILAGQRDFMTVIICIESLSNSLDFCFLLDTVTGVSFALCLCWRSQHARTHTKCWTGSMGSVPLHSISQPQSTAHRICSGLVVYSVCVTYIRMWGHVMPAGLIGCNHSILLCSPVCISIAASPTNCVLNN